MFCRKCGAQLPDDAKFCGACGTKVMMAGEFKAAPSPEPQSMNDEQPQQTWQREPAAKADGGQSMTLLRIFSVAMAVVFAGYFLRQIADVFGTIGSLFGSFYISLSLVFTLLYLVFSAVRLVLFALTLWMFILIARKWESTYSDSLFAVTAAACVLDVAACLLAGLLQTLELATYGWGFAFPMGKSLIIVLVVSLIGIFGLYGILVSMNCAPNLMMEKGSLGEWLANGAADVMMLSKEKKGDAGQQAQGGTSANTQSTSYRTGSAAAGTAADVQEGMLQTDRSLLIYILLNCVTCGIYSLYFIHKAAKEVNIACAGDGYQTAGLLKYILLSCVTCGIYGIIWNYSLGNRLAANGPRYGLNIQENGTTILLWQIFGSLLCGIGAFIALHIMIKNINAICRGYNVQNGYTIG